MNSILKSGFLIDQLSITGSVLDQLVAQTSQLLPAPGQFALSSLQNRPHRSMCHGWMDGTATEACPATEQGMVCLDPSGSLGGDCSPRPTANRKSPLSGIVFSNSNKHTHIMLKHKCAVAHPCAITTATAQRFPCSKDPEERSLF